VKVSLRKAEMPGSGRNRPRLALSDGSFTHDFPRLSSRFAILIHSLGENRQKAWHAIKPDSETII